MFRVLLFLCFSLLGFFTLPKHYGICDRTREVQLAILNRLEDKEGCEQVTTEELRGIVSLKVSQTGLTTLKKRDFANLTSLEGLFLDHNQFRELPGELFVGLNSLVELWINNNQLETLPKNLFSSLKSLKALHLNNNHLNLLSAQLFSGLNSLERLDIHNNELKSLLDEIFFGLSNLKWLNIHNNKMENMPESVFFLSSLQTFQFIEGNLFSEDEIDRVKQKKWISF